MIRRMFRALIIAAFFGACAEVSVQATAMVLTAYGWLPYAVAVVTFVIVFAILYTQKGVKNV